jgi:hypothetical protein
VARKPCFAECFGFKMLSSYRVRNPCSWRTPTYFLQSKFSSSLALMSCKVHCFKLFRTKKWFWVIIARDPHLIRKPFPHQLKDTVVSSLVIWCFHQPFPYVVHSSALFFNRFVNEIFGTLFYETFGRSILLLIIYQKKILNMSNFYYKTGIWNLKLTVKTMGNGNFKHDFAFTNLWKNVAEPSIFGFC